MNFFSILAHRLQREPSPELESKLERRLDQEFLRESRSRVPERKFGFSIGIFRWVPLGLTAGLLFVIAVQVGDRPAANFSPDGGMAFTRDAFLLESGDYEFYDELEDWMLTASDEEWNEILNEKNT